MKKTILLITAAFLICMGANAQWTQTNGPVFGNITCMDTCGTDIFAANDNGYLFKSSNNGMTWSVIFVNYFNSANSNIYCIGVNGNTIWVGTYGGIYYANNTTGAVFNHPATGVGLQVYSIAFVGTDIFTASSNGLYVSSNNGTTWTQKLSALAFNVFTNGTNIFANHALNYLELSTNGGNTWTNVNTTATMSGNRPMVFSGGNTFVGEGSQVFLSINNGTNWTSVSTGLPATLSITSLTMNGTALFAGTRGGGIYTSTNNGTTWTAVNSGLPTLNVYSIFHTGSVLFAGTDKGIFKSINNGISWVASNSGVSTTNILGITSLGNRVFAGVDIQTSGYTELGYFTDDSGNQWDSIKNFVAFPGTCCVIGSTIYTLRYDGLYSSIDSGKTMVMAPNVGWTNPGGTLHLSVIGNNFYATDPFTYEIYLSSDFGATWNLLCSTSPYEFFKIVKVGANLFGVDNTWNDVSISTDNGLTWTPLSIGLQGASFTYLEDIATDGTNIYIGGQYGLFKSPDSGVTWINLTTGPAFPITPAVKSIILSSNTVYILAGTVVYFSKDLGNTWTLLGGGSPVSGSSSITTIAIAGKNLYAGTNNQGIWSAPISLDVWPGDADNNFVVDNTDLLPIGLQYGQTGLSRNVQGNLWQADSCLDWGTTQPNGINTKHADCNGDGTVNANDTLAINQNFNLVHTISVPHSYEKTNAPSIYFITNASTYNAGDTVDVEVWAGTSTTPVSNLYGLAFTINYTASLVQPGTESLTYPVSWLGTPGTNAIKISKIDALATNAYGAETRINHTNASGYGKIADLKFQVKTHVASVSSFNLSISNYIANNTAGAPVVFTSTNDTLTINAGTLGINSPIDNGGGGQSTIYISPNPFTSQTIIYFDKEQKNTIIKVTDVLGNVIQQLTTNNKQLAIDITGNPKGIYFVQITDENKNTINRKIIIQ